MIDRRTLLAAAILMPALGGQGFAADPFIYRVGGAVSDQNFEGLATLLMKSVDQFVGLKLVIPSQGDGPNALFAEESGGHLSVYRRGGDVNLAFASGYHKTGDKYYVDGFFKVAYDGLHQGIKALGISPARTMDVESSGKPMKDIDIGQLPADAKG
ncbi:MAG TPA: hypothetical protein VIU14_03900 [Mesorhizobium sp.]